MEPWNQQPKEIVKIIADIKQIIRKTIETIKPKVNFF